MKKIEFIVGCTLFGQPIIHTIWLESNVKPKHNR